MKKIESFLDNFHDCIEYKEIIQTSYGYEQYILYIEFETMNGVCDALKTVFELWLETHGYNITNDPFYFGKIIGYNCYNYRCALMFDIDNRIQFLNECEVIESLLNEERFNIY